MGGGGAQASSIGLKSMQNTIILVLFRPIFGPEMKIVPPTGLAIRSCKGLAVIWGQFFFWTPSLVDRQKNSLNLGEDLFLEGGGVT